MRWIHNESFGRDLTYGLAQRSALANGNLITLNDTESWRDVGGKVLVSLLVSGVLGDEVKVLSADDEGAVHLGGDNRSGQDTTTDGDETGEWALLVCESPKLAFYPHPTPLSVYPRLLIHVSRNSLIPGAKLWTSQIHIPM